MHTAKCKSYTEGIALASSSKELHQVVNRNSPKILPTIFPSADLSSIFINHFTNKVEKIRANIASKHVTTTLITGTTTTTFSSFEKVSQLTVKECILISAPKSRELDPIPSKLLIECLDSILPSEHIGRLARMSVLDTDVDGSSPGSSMLFPLSKTLYSHCFSRLSCEISTRWGQPREGCSVL